MAQDSASQTELADGALRLAVDDQVATITLSRPERRNAVTPAIWLALAEIGASLPERVRVVVVRAEGPSFCAGIDLKVLAEASSTGASTAPLDEEQIAGYQAGYLWLANPAIVSIAAVQGHAIGAGFQLALACDVRILADDAKFCMKEPALGLVPDLTGTKPLVELVGLPRAIELCLTTRTVEAGEAIALRLAELMVPASELDAAVGDLVAALLATDAAAARATKALLAQAGGNTLEQQAAAERQAQLKLIQSRLGG
ncbi:MAG TPA: enoyl-CoA hydratase/isomerase family protein [Streptosporangiaceae bacterium]|nr:enoyl-CoA hydratase/isomerase family protein [Streptosporangiaceae bacterium]